MTYEADLVESITEGKGGFPKSLVDELGPTLSDLGNRIFERVKKYAHSPMRWDVDFNDRAGFSSCYFVTTDLSDIEVKGDMIIDWMGVGDFFVRVTMQTTGGSSSGSKEATVKVYMKEPIDKILIALIGMCKNANLTGG